MPFVAEKYPELKANLEKAVQKKDSNEIANALNAIEKQIPEEVIPPKDKEMIKKAEDQMEKLDQPISEYLISEEAPFPIMRLCLQRCYFR